MYGSISNDAYILDQEQERLQVFSRTWLLRDSDFGLRINHKCNVVCKLVFTVAKERLCLVNGHLLGRCCDPYSSTDLQEEFFFQCCVVLLPSSCCDRAFEIVASLKVNFSQANPLSYILGNKSWANYSANVGYFYLEMVLYVVSIYFYISMVPEKYVSKKYHSIVSV